MYKNCIKNTLTHTCTCTQVHFPCIFCGWNEILLTPLFFPVEDVIVLLNLLSTNVFKESNAVMMLTPKYFQTRLCYFHELKHDPQHVILLQLTHIQMFVCVMPTFTALCSTAVCLFTQTGYHVDST